LDININIRVVGPRYPYFRPHITSTKRMISANISENIGPRVGNNHMSIVCVKESS